METESLHQEVIEGKMSSLQDVTTRTSSWENLTSDWGWGNRYIARGWHCKRYSVIAITLRYVFAFLHNALYLWRKVITSDSYRLILFVGIIAYDSYRSELAGQRYRFTLLLF
jgi:hypothetical protein